MKKWTELSRLISDKVRVNFRSKFEKIVGLLLAGTQLRRCAAWFKFNYSQNFPAKIIFPTNTVTVLGPFLQQQQKRIMKTKTHSNYTFVRGEAAARKNLPKNFNPIKFHLNENPSTKVIRFKDNC